MPEHVDVKELLAKIDDEEVRGQLNAAFDGLSGSTLRQQVTTLQEEVKSYRDRERKDTYRAAGVPESAYDVFDKVYDGDLTADAVKMFAKEKGFAISDSGPATPDPAVQRATGEQRLAAISQGAIPARDPSTTDQISKADSEGDWQTANRLRASQLLPGLRPS